MSDPFAKLQAALVDAVTTYLLRSVMCGKYAADVREAFTRSTSSTDSKLFDRWLARELGAVVERQINALALLSAVSEWVENFKSATGDRPANEARPS